MKCPIALAITGAFVLAGCDRSSGTSTTASSTAVIIGDSTSARSATATHSSYVTSSALIPSQLPAGDTLPDSVDLQCSPRRATLNDTITLRMQIPHGEYLMVMQPDSTVFFLSYPDSTEPRDFSLVQADSFAKMPVIRFRAGVRSRPHVYGRDTFETVFSKRGKYVLTIGHKLETEHSSQIHTCTLQLAATKQ